MVAAIGRVSMAWMYCLLWLGVWCSTVTAATTFSRRNLTSYLLNPTRYDATIIPDFDEEYPTNVSVQITITDMHSLSEANMEYSVDMYMRMWWRDERLDFTNLANYSALELDVKSMGSVWQPDMFFQNEKRATVHTVTTANKLLHIARNGTIVYSIRLSLALSCNMQLQYYPFDQQVCPMYIQSFAYTKSNIDLSWYHSSPFTTTELEMPQFSLAEDETELTDYEAAFAATGTFSTLQANLVLKRKIGFYFLQVFVPSILLVVLSWVSFWVDAGAVPARVSLGVTCVLTMTTQSSGIRQSLPPVSYVKAIDVWMFVCLLFVFAALLEFAYVNVLLRRKNKQGTDSIYENANVPAEGNSVPPASGDEEKSKCNVKWLSLKSCKYAERAPIEHARRVDYISRYAFPGSFISFLMCFFLTCILAS